MTASRVGVEWVEVLVQGTSAARVGVEWVEVLVLPGTAHTQTTTDNLGLLDNTTQELTTPQTQTTTDNLGLTDTSTQAVAAWDDFTETSDTALTSHTPTGPNAGAGWAAGLFGPGGATVRAATDDLIDAAQNSNRFRMTTDLGFDRLDVQCDFTHSQAPGTAVFPGVAARSAASDLGVEFLWDATNGRWLLDDNVSVSTTTNDTWPGTATMRLIIPGDGNMYGYVNDVLKCTITSNAWAGNHFTGIILGNFAGSSGLLVADNFKANLVLLHTQTTTDNAGLTDSTAQVLAAAQTTSDTLGLLDSTSSDLTITQTTTDAVGLLDNTTQELTTQQTQTTTDNLGLTDSTSPASVYARTTTDNLGLVDSAPTPSNNGRLLRAGGTGYLLRAGGSGYLLRASSTSPPTEATATDNVGLTDSTTQVLSAAQTTTDAVGLVDSTTQIFTITATQTDAVGLVDARTQVLVAARTTTDPLGLVDSTPSPAAPSGLPILAPGFIPVS